MSFFLGGGRGGAAGNWGCDKVVAIDGRRKRTCCFFPDVAYNRIKLNN